MKLRIMFFILVLQACKSPEQKDEVVTSSIDLVSADGIFADIVPNADALPPFDRLDYDRVVAYDYGGRGEDAMSPIIDGDGELHPSVINQKNLTQEQVNELTIYLGAEETYGNGTASCFEPHLGLVFYKGDSIAAHISICLLCNRLRSSVEIPATGFKKMYAGTDAEFNLEGFSKNGQQKLLDLCNELEFSHCSGYEL